MAFIKTSSGTAIIKSIVLVLICFVSVSSRLFSVLRFESIIHEFDPWFNYRATKYLVSNGYYAFLNWFDETAWYPLGRVVGGTVFPGIMVTSALIHHILQEWIRIPVDIRHVCVFLAPGFSALAALATYGLAKEIDGSNTTALLATIFIGIIPGYISRSVAGSYDNEAIAIFLLIVSFYYWIKAVKYGSAFYAAVTAFFYFCMASAWGGYVFIINLIPLHAFVLILMGRYTVRLYTAYSTFYVLATIASMTVPFIGVNPTRTSDHIAALGIFGLMQLVGFAYVIQSYLPSNQFKQLVTISLVSIFLTALGGLVLLSMLGVVAPWTERFYSLYDTDYARKNIPIVASVSEHQPTAWSSFFFDLQLLIFVFPAGVYLCLKDLSEGSVFVILYAAAASYFAGVMVRLMLTLTPIVCVASAIVFGRLIDTYMAKFHDDSPCRSSASTSTSHLAVTPSASTSTSSTTTSPKAGTKIAKEVRIAVVTVFFLLLCLLVRHCAWVTSNAYSSPSVVLASYDRQGHQVIIDDFREAYYWLRKNTHKDTRVMSWWDYGYQIAGFSDRTTLVDNNTWNNSHIATVGKAMSTSEKVSYEVMRMLDVDYVLVICGAVSGYSGDDINKFLWMIRIAEGIFPDDVQETKFFTPQGQYRVDDAAPATMRESLMYKMSYYRIHDIMGGRALDNARNSGLPDKDPELTVLEEAFSSERYIVRIFKVKRPDSLGRNLFDVAAFEKTNRV